MEVQEFTWTLPDGSQIEPGKVYEFDGDMTNVVSVSDLPIRTKHETNEIVERYYNVTATNNEHSLVSSGVGSRSLSRLVAKYRKAGYRVSWEETLSFIRRDEELQEVLTNPVDGSNIEHFPEPSYQCPSDHAEPDMNYERARAKVSRSTYTSPEVQIVEPDYSDPRSKLYGNFLEDVQKNGYFEVEDKATKVALRFNRSAAAKFLVESNRPFSDFNIRRIEYRV